MRTTERTNQFKRDYKRETKGRSKAYAQKLDIELAAVVQVLRADGTLDPRHEDHP
jgi:mRNA interferase YafQ